MNLRPSSIKTDESAKTERKQLESDNYNYIEKNPTLIASNYRTLNSPYTPTYKLKSAKVLQRFHTLHVLVHSVFPILLVYTTSNGAAGFFPAP